MFPDVTGKALDSILQFFEHYKIVPEVQYPKTSTTHSYLIIEQRPLAGTIMSLEKPPHVQLRVIEAQEIPD